MNELFKIALKAAENGRSYAFATVIESTLKGTPQKAGAKMVVLEDGTLVGTIGGGRNEKAAREECLKAIKHGKPCIVTYDFFGGEGQSVCGGRIKVFIEPFLGQKKLVICGAGHIALPLSIYAKMLNFHVTIIDNRLDFTNSKRFPHVDALIVGLHAEKLAQQTFSKDTLVVVVTQGNEYDFECLRVAVKKDIGYLGVISSRAKRIKFIKRLKDLKVPAKKISTVKMPAGIDIGAQTPEEIAISIISEIISTVHQENLGTDKFMDRFINQHKNTRKPNDTR